MSNPFASLKTNESAQEETDYLGGGGTLTTSAYTGKVKMAYASKAANSDAQSMVLIVDLDNNGSSWEYREDLWVSSKTGQTYYEYNGEKKLLKGYINAEAICLLTTGVPLLEQNFEEKVVNVYDSKDQKEKPTNVQVFVDVIGQEITLGIVEEIHIKQKKNASGVYENTSDTVKKNQIDKVFHTESLRTVPEIRSEQEEPVFYHQWMEKNDGKEARDRTKGKARNTGSAGSPPKAGDSKPPSSSLFNKK